MTGLEGLTLAVVLAGILILFVFIWVFEKIGENRRNTEYAVRREDRIDGRTSTNEGRIAKLYTTDYHDFERPKADINQDTTNESLNEINKRLYELEKKSKEVN